MKLRQTGTVELYQENFDSLLSRLDLATPQAISCFLSGLTKEIQNAVRMFRPQTLHVAYCLAKLQEATLQSIARKTRPWGDRGFSHTKTLETGQRRSPQYSNAPSLQRTSSNGPYVRDGPTSGSNGPSARTRPASSMGSVTSRPRTVSRSLNSKEIEQKRAKNLCFLCDEAYFPGHKCKVQVYSLEVIEEVKEDGEEEVDRMEEEIGHEQQQGEQ